MNLKSYIDAERGNGTSLAAALRIPISYLSQMASGNRAISPERAVAIEGATGGQVTRKELFPESWQRIWPELDRSKRTKPQAAQAEGV